MFGLIIVYDFWFEVFHVVANVPLSVSVGIENETKFVGARWNGGKSVVGLVSCLLVNFVLGVDELNNIIGGCGLYFCNNGSCGLRGEQCWL